MKSALKTTILIANFFLLYLFLLGPSAEAHAIPKTYQITLQDGPDEPRTICGVIPVGCIQHSKFMG